ncbi:MAG TPA: tetratricopeptide repeat protein [Puia sp.]|jgi:tetratricopeptide (TPR) repeat protein
MLFLGSLLASVTGYAQPADALIRKGNRYYKAQDFDQSKANYEKALKQSPGNVNANFNLGNAEFRKNDFERAAAGYDEVLKGNTDTKTREDGWYNKGVAMIKQKKLDESIDAWKHALELNPEDQEARDNLVKALLEKKKQQQQNNSKDKKDKKPKPDKQNQQQKDQQKNQEDNRPKPQQSKLSKQQVEQYLRSLIQREKDVQDKMNQSKTHTPDQPDKDW